MVRKQGHTQLPITLAEGFRKSAEALTVIGASITKEDQPSGRIEAKRGPSFTSWGENLVAEISGADGAASISIASSSALPTTLFDFGTNQRNVNRFLDLLRR
jgi:hypothetical protein